MTTSTDDTMSLTGNPFVDTGLAVIAFRAGLDDVERLTVSDVQKVHGDGSDLAGFNEKLHSFTMVFTKNSLLTNASIRDRTERLKMYKGVVNELLAKIGQDEVSARCESCGGAKTLNFDWLCWSALAETTAKDQARFIGRDWFPLAGSMGSDAQALPAASRPVHLCAKCLFAVHYLPLGLILLGGRLAVFQSTSVEFWYELVREIVIERESRNQAGDYSNIGAKEGSRGFVERLLKLFERLQKARRFPDIPRAAALEAWRFTNSNPPSCDIVEIPNKVLTFLWEAVGWNLRQEVTNLVSREGKKDRPFLHCVLEGQDYMGLYPRGNFAGVSPRLFTLYQTSICGRTPSALALAHTLAYEQTEKLKPKEIERFRRAEALSDASVRTQFRGTIARLISVGKFRLLDYLGLFPINEDAQGVMVSFEGWNLIRYWLHHIGEFACLRAQPSQPSLSSPKLAMLRYYAARIMQDCASEPGKDRFRSEVLNRIERGDIGVAWLRQQFLRLAENDLGFNYEAWKRLCCNNTGRIFGRELLFQMRLLWSEWLQDEGPPQVPCPEFPNGSGLPNEVLERLKRVFSQNMEARGRARFHKTVLKRLRRKDFGLAWFRRCLTQNGRDSDASLMSEVEWEDFLRDEDGRPYAQERLFQMHLLLANLFRETNA
jgi:CRISPR-associated protein Cst1